MNTRKIALFSLLISFGSVLYIIETFIPFPAPIPGGRWGFSNMTILLALQFCDYKDIIFFSILKNSIGSLLTGKFATVGYLMGISGLVVASVFMLFLYRRKNKFGLISISITGAALNNFIQLLIASSLIVKNSNVLVLYPYYLIIGSISAVANAFIVVFIYERTGEGIWKI